jgi:hypothetical protein
MEVGWTIEVDSVVNNGMLVEVDNGTKSNGDAENDREDIVEKSDEEEDVVVGERLGVDKGEQLSTSAPGPEIGVRSTPSIPNKVPASSEPYDVTTMLTVCVSPVTTCGTPKGSQSELANSNEPPQGTSSTRIRNAVR